MSYSALQAEYEGRAFQNQTYSEIFLQEHQQNTNIVYGSQNKVLDSRLMKIHTEWSQVFDLGEASLIVMMHANQMRMKLIHFTESHLTEYQNMVIQGREKLPELQGGEKAPASFMVTDESQKNTIRTVFQKLSTAQLVVEGIIVPNIVLTYQRNPVQSSNGAHKQVYTLSFVTSLRKLYQVDFDSYFFKANQNIIVNGPRDLDINGTVTSFDLATSMKTNGIIYQFIVGTTISQANSTTYEQVKQSMEDTLFFLKGTPSKGYVIERITQLADQGLVQNVKQAFLKTKMADILQNAAPTQFFLGNASKGAQQTGLQAQQRGGLEEGVVFVKQLTNSMVAVIYTTGWLRIWSTESERCIKEHNILGYDDEITDLTSFQFRDKIVRAKLDFHKRDFWVDEFALNFDLAVVYSVRTISQSANSTLGHSGYEFTWHVTQLHMQVQLHDKMRALVDETNESLVDFSNATLATLQINMNQTLKLNPNEDVVDLIYESEQKQHRNKEIHLWLITSTFDEESQSHRGKIIDLKSEVSRIWDRECQMKYENMLDYLDVPDELLNKHSRFSERIATHYIKRILDKGRFQPQILSDILARYDNQMDSQVNEDRLQRIAFTLTGLRDLKTILKDCKIFEQQISRLIGFSRQMKNHAYRVVIREVGVSIVKPDSYYQSIYLRESLACFQLNKIENDTLQLSQIKQFFPLNQSEGLYDELLVTLMGAIRYLHFNSLELFDESLLKFPENGVKSFLSVLLREQYANQALLFEIGKSLELNRDIIEQQLYQTISDLLSFLNQTSQTNQNIRTSFVPTGRHPSQLFSLPLLKMVEKGLSQELDSLYCFIRDLLLVKAFLELNSPNLSRQSEQFELQEYNLSTLEAWLIQIASLRRILKMSFTYDQLQYSRSKCRGETESLLKSLNNQYANEPHTYLTYLILKRYHQSSPIGLWKRPIGLLAEDVNLGRRQSFNDLYNDFLKGNLFQIEREDSTSDLIYPNFARTLLKLKQWNLIIEYLEPMIKSELSYYQTLSLELAYAIALANSGDQASEFANRIRNCILLFKQSENVIVAPITDYIFDNEKSMAQEISEYVRAATTNFQLQFYLTIALQLKSLDPRYELFVLLSALKESNISAKDSDMFYERLFNTAKQISLNNGGGIDFMYEALTKTLAKDQRQRMIGEFLLYYTTISQKGFKSQGSIHFSHDDIDLAEVYLVNKLETEFPREATVNVSQVLQVLGLILSIGETYSRQIETARYLWLLNQRVESLINTCQSFDKLRPYQSMLRLQMHILKHLYISALTMGEHLLILDDSAVRQKNSNEPSIQRRAKPSGEGVQESPEDFEERILNQGLSYFKSDKYDYKFHMGYLTRITQEDLRRCIIQAEARLRCSELEITKDTDRLVKILSEIKEYDLAVELALASRKPTDVHSLVAYPIMSMISEYEKAMEKKNESQLEDAQMVVEDEQEKSNDETRFNLRQMTLVRNENIVNKDFNKETVIAQQFEQIVSRLLVTDVLEIAKALVSQKIAIPKLLEQRIIEHGQLKFLLEYYLSEEFLNITAALDLLTKNDLEKNVKELADIDLQLLATFIDILDRALVDNEDLLIELTNDEQHRIKVLTNGRAIDDFTISQDFGDDLEDFLGVDSKQLFAQVMDRKDIEKGNDVELDLIRGDLETTQTFINSLKDSIPKIKGTLVNYLNGENE